MAEHLLGLAEDTRMKKGMVEILYINTWDLSMLDNVIFVGKMYVDIALR